MKKSRRLIRNTVLALGGAMILYVGVNRLNAVNAEPEVPRQTTTATELAQLRDFSAVRVNGPFSVDIVQQAGHSVEFTPAVAGSGDFFASVHEHVLVLNGSDAIPGGHVRVGMPALTELIAAEGAAVTVAGFRGERLSIRLGEAGPLVLRNNAIAHWDIVAGEGRELQFDRASIGAGSLEVAGRARITVID